MKKVLLLIMLMFVTTASAVNIDFDSSTPDNGTQSETYINVSYTTTDTNDIYSFIDFNESVVGWWRLDNDSAKGENDTHIYDWTGGGNDGTVTNAVVTSTPSFTNGFYFDGSGDYISIPYSQDFNFSTDDQFSVSARVNMTSDTSAIIISQIDWSNKNMWSIGYDAGGDAFNFVVYHNGTSGNFTMCWCGGHAIGSEYHILGVWNGTHMLMWIDGVLEDTETGSSDIMYHSDVPIYMGATSNLQNYLNGTIDEVVMFNRSLSSDECLALHNATSTYHNFTNLPDESHIFTAYAVDNSSDMNQTAERTVTIDPFSGVLKQAYPDSNTDSMRQMRNASGYYNYYSQSFQAVSTYHVSQISLNMSKDAGHAGNFTCYLYGASGTHGTDAYPSGTLLSTSNSLTDEITTTPALVNFTFPNTYTVQDGDNYTIVVHTDQPSGNNGYVGADLTSPTDPGNFASHLYVDSWGTWSPSTSRDMIYYIYSFPVEYHLMQSYPDSHADARRSLRDASGYNNYYSQSFTAISSYDVSRVQLNMSKDAGHTGNFTCYIYETLGTSGTNAYPSSSLLGTSDALTTEITSTPQLVNFTFATVAGVTEGSDYAIVIYTDQPGSANGYVGADLSSPSAEGNYAEHLYGDPWGTWSPSTTRDLIYYLYGAAAAPGTPVITGYSPVGAIYPEVQDSQTFEITVDQNTVCRWYINGSLKETDASSSTHAYTNSSLHGGVWNVTAVANNTYGAAVQTWIFEVGADSITFIVLQDQPTNRTKIAEFEVTRIGSNVTQWSHNQSFTFNDWKYVFRFTNSTEIVNHTATYTNQTLLFNRTPMLPPGTYYLNVQGMVLTAAANQYFMFNNWTTPQTFSQIATNEANDIVYTWYNHNSGLYESYFVGRSYNANAIVPENCSVSGFFSAQTTISPLPRTATTIIGGGWFNAIMLGTADMTPSEIEASMDADGLDCWAVYRWTGTAYATTGDVEPCEGMTVYCNNTGEWSI